MRDFRLDRYLNPKDSFNDLSSVKDTNKNILQSEDNLDINKRSIDKIKFYNK